MERLVLLAPRGSRSRWIAARALACTGALLFVVASWLPWSRVTATFPGASGQSFTMEISATTFPLLLYVRLSPTHSIDSVLLERVLGLLWYGVLAGGVLLALPLWQRASARLAVAAKRLFRAWLLLSTALALLAAWLFLSGAPWAGVTSSIQIVRSETGPGFWLALAALALLWIAALLMASEPRVPPHKTPPATYPTWRRSRVQLLGFATLLAGILLWSLGYNAFPWATVNCPAPRLSLTHFVDGSCAGLDSGDTLMAAVAPYLPDALSSYAAEALLLIDVLLIGSALLLLAGAARHSYTRAFCGWVLAWLLAATSIALLSYYGVSAVVAHPPILSSAAVGTWHRDSGIFVTFAGLMCGWASLIPLESATIRRSPSAALMESAGPVAVHAVEP